MTVNMWNRAKRLSNISRSIAGPGIRDVLKTIKSEINDLQIHSVETGTQCFDWTVPKEWSCKRATIKKLNGELVIDTDVNPLHVVIHSTPKSEIMSLRQLKGKLHTCTELPDAIPYVTSYYRDDWGFCLTQNQYDALDEAQYMVDIDTELRDGVLNYGELFIKGQSSKEIIISTYICHPYMGNNESSGPSVAIELANSLMKDENYYSIRVLFIPETIGSLAFLSKNMNVVKKNCVAGFNITCVGDELKYSFLGSKYGNTMTDRAALQSYKEHGVVPDIYPWQMRGSDERQYCSPLIELPFVSMMRSMYNTYPEYHTSADNMNFVSENGMRGAFAVIKTAIDIIQSDRIPLAKTYGEPKLDKINLYRNHSLNGAKKDSNKYLQVLTYCDGKNELSYVRNLSGLGLDEFKEVVEQLLLYELIELL